MEQDVLLSDELLEQVRSATASDPVLQLIRNFLINGWTTSKDINPKCSPFYKFKNSLAYVDGLLFMKGRIVIPRVLHASVLHKLHAGHLGIIKCRRLAQGSVWWLGISKYIASQVTDCHTCSMNRKYFDRRGGANKEQQDEVVGKTIHVKNKDISGVIAAKHAAPRSYFVQTEDQKQITTPLSFGKVTEKWPVTAQPAPPGNLQLSSERRPQRIVRPPQRLDL
ncbi:hypothetical protein GE061_008715 [Apolygus lucorum]|uniref:RNA-directed DNA polymerase n=1 Tax=Apolygus lucorum TaxID=248454 RepID=A0A8S9WNE9_APOLU|nr:hypothetical protein GE061_008715 [Apolygus lucorum]